MRKLVDIGKVANCDICDKETRYRDDGVPICPKCQEKVNGKGE